MASEDIQSVELGCFKDVNKSFVGNSTGWWTIMRNHPNPNRYCVAGYEVAQEIYVNRAQWDAQDFAD